MYALLHSTQCLQKSASKILIFQTLLKENTDISLQYPNHYLKLTNLNTNNGFCYGNYFSAILM